MILHGNQRGGGKDLALHLMKDENERVQVHELRGFVSDTLIGAFTESYAISKATRCKQHLYSLSINPSKDADVDDSAFVDAVEQVEKKLGLSGQPRAIVFHEKRGEDGELRRHAHAVWCRIDVDQMKAVQMSHDRHKLRDVSRDLHIQHDLTMPKGLINSKDRDPRNFTLEEWQQCKRAKKDVHEVKDTFKDAWAISDSQASFAHALAEQGYILAKGNRGHVAVDYKGEKYAISRYVGIKAKQVRQKLGEVDALPDVERAQQLAAKQVIDRLNVLKSEKQAQANRIAKAARSEQNQVKKRQARATDALRLAHAQRQEAEEQSRQDRLRKGFMGLVDRVTGKRKRTLLKNQMEKAAADQRDRTEVQSLQNLQWQALAERRKRNITAEQPFRNAIKELETDIDACRKPTQQTLHRDQTRLAAKDLRQRSSCGSHSRQSRLNPSPEI
ncbi:MAG: relaxase [Pseudomonadota bacterium]